MDKEIVFNIWFIVDIGLECASHWLVKPYCMQGSDEEKLQILNFLAESDFQTATRNKIPDNVVSKFSNTEITGIIPRNEIFNYFESNLEYFIDYIENELPLIFEFDGSLTNNGKTIKQKIIQSPLFCATILMENEYGEIRPYVSDENKKWFESEKIRLTTIK